LLILVDDVYLAFGKLRFRPSGSHGGHNGLLSVSEALGTEFFARLRIGIGAPPAGVERKEFVLDTFTKEEKNKLGPVLDEAAQAALLWVCEPLEKVMQRVNG
ncbi:MAG: aminoacyl-tRNA hydrolase, partial [Candidatus Omnitrophica bacterium]|nr:aminoacyl-tRNA hydrolase [Candidatus Omnitrophota bacterium]